MSRTPRGARRPVLALAPDPGQPPPQAGSNTCGAQIEAMLAQAEATTKLAKAGEALAFAIQEATQTLAPAAEAIAHLGDAQKKLCNFLVKHRLKLAMSVPAVLVTVGAVSPNAAQGLREVLTALAAVLGHAQ